jgi:hypothetical protein
LKPHPLFDSTWYLDTNPDVAAAQMNPLEHYLYFGSGERRTPNRFFNVAWYRDQFFNDFRHRQASRIEPLSNYVMIGFARGCPPGPGLSALAKASARLTPHGPKSYVDCLESNRNLYAEIVHRRRILPTDFKIYMTGSIERYNRSFAENMVVLRKPKIALMFSAKCASARIFYWWLQQADLLKCALRFSPWSHDFEQIFRLSRYHIEDGLTFDPDRYRTYKFVRNPLLRATSAFTHLLTDPRGFGLTVAAHRQSLSFLEYLDLLSSTDIMQRDGHFQPQLTATEAAGAIKPVILKIEDGLEAHLAELEQRHGLPSSTFEQDPEISMILRNHTRQSQPRISVGPTEQIRFGDIPCSRPLLTPETIGQLYALYRCDFDAYGYQP